MSGKAKDVMTEHPVWVDAEETLSTALGKIVKAGVSAVPVVEKGKVIGIVDSRLIGKHRRIHPEAKVRHVMVVTPEITPETPLVEVAEILLMHDLRSVPVTEKGKLVGIISRMDLVRFLSAIDEVRRIPVREVMTMDPKYVTPDDSVATALKVMEEMEERNVPVVNGGKLVGVIGMKDLTPAFLRPVERMPKGPSGKESRLSLPVRGFMRDPIFVGKDAKLGEVMDLMIEKRISMIPVVDREIMGVITMYDILEFLARYRKRDTVFVQITGLRAEAEVLDELYRLIGTHIDRISHFQRPRTLLVHVVENHTHLYEVSVRMTTSEGLFTSKREGWDLFLCVEECLDAIETQVRKRRRK